MYQSRTFFPAPYHWVSYVENLLKVKTGLVYHIVYYKSIINHFTQLYSEQLNKNILPVDIGHYLHLI